MESKLSRTVEAVKGRIADGKYQSESAVREAIILPILGELGWDILNPDVVIRELNLSGRRVDYGLAVHPARPNVFVEVKAVGGAAGADRQLFEYAFHEGIPMAVLTDGKEWHFYHPSGQGSYEERRLYKLDFMERDASDCADRLERYLGFARVKSGDALNDAQRDFREASQHRLASQSIPRAWQEIIDEPDELLIELIAERTETICGYRPDAVEIEKFLVDLRKGVIERPILSRSVSEAEQRAARPSPDVRKIKLEYRLLNQNYSAPNATQALVDILKSLASRQSDFWVRLEPLARTRKRNHLARSKHEVYPDKPELEQYTVEIAPGWWLGTNISNRSKKGLLEAACKAADLVFGRDLQINLPNT